MPNAFVHCELNTDAVPAAKKFYKAMFDWKMQDVPMGPGVYTMIDVGKRDSGGGIQAKPMPEAPTQWVSYVEVANVKKSVAKARKLGATIVQDYTPIGDNMGAIALFVDPTGAALGLWEKAAAPRKPARKAAAKKAKRR